MSINISAEQNRANNLKSQITNIQSAIKKLELYKNSISTNWNGQEVAFILQAINQSITRLKSSISSIESLSSKVVSTASAIKKEEDEAAARLARQRQEQEARRREAEVQRQREQRIAQAQTEYNTAKEQFDSAKKQYDTYKKKYDKTSILIRWTMTDELNRLKEKMDTAESVMKECYAALLSARQ